MYIIDVPSSGEWTNQPEFVVQIQQTARDAFQVQVRTSRVHRVTFCYRPAALPVQHHFLADDMREREAIQEGEWDRGRGKVEEGEKRKGDEGEIGRGGEKGDEGERCDVPHIMQALSNC